MDVKYLIFSVHHDLIIEKSIGVNTLYLLYFGIESLFVISFEPLPKNAVISMNKRLT